MFIKGANRKYDTVCGVLSNLKTISIDEPLSEESGIIVDGIVEFILAVETLKKLFKITLLCVSDSINNRHLANIHNCNFGLSVMVY